MGISAGIRQALPSFIQDDRLNLRQIFFWMREIHQGKFYANGSFPGTLSASAINSTSTLSVSGTVVAQNVAKAWIRFQGTATASATAKFNVSTVSRSATGTYVITFGSVFPNTNYSFQVTAYDLSGDARIVQPVTIASATFKFKTHQGLLSVFDSDIVCASFWNL